ncbi:MAG TPA: outer membrane beta-barrel protein [Polyangia bacterium]|nr:outer membrane beta-barrel protein [Polyangia bacterium]
MKTLVTVLTLAVALTLGPAVQAHNFRGENELSGGLGGQVGMHDSPGGGLFAAEYGYRLSQITWLNLELDMAFGGGRDCFVDRAGFVTCDRFGGEALDLIAGAKWKFVTRNEHLVPYLKVGGGLAFLFFPGPDNDAIAPIVRVGGGLKYFVLPNLGVGGEMSAAFGPGIYSCGPGCSTGDLYAAWNIMGGVEFNF